MKWLRLILIPFAISLFVSLSYAHRETCPSCGGSGVIPGPVLGGAPTVYGCTKCGGSGGGGSPGTPGRGWIEVPDTQPSEENNQTADTEAARQAAESERKQAIEEQQKKDQEEQRRKQAEFDKAKQEAIASMKGLHTDDGLGLKGVGGSDDLGLKGGSSQTDSLGLKGMDDSPSELKDAVAESNRKTVFTQKRASRDLLSAHAHGSTALERAASILGNAASNPLLETSLEQAKAETDRRFSSQGKDVGEFSTVVLGGYYSIPATTPGARPPLDPAKVAALAQNKNFQRLVIERDALNHQITAAEANLKKIKADPSYAQSTTLLTEAYKQDNAVESLKTMRAYDSDQIKRAVTFESVNFDDESPSATPAKKIDGIVVPPPSPAAATP